MKMKNMERNVIRLAAVQHLRSAYGIKTKNWNKNKSGRGTSSSTSTKIFGIPLESLPHYNMEHGRVPSFLVDACMNLLAHVDTEGLFRKSGSVVRLKALRTKLDAGEECLSTALPCDVAGLLKQFFRELPEPALPTELHEALLKAQQLPTEEDKMSATLLLSCILPDRNLSTLKHFFDFLHNVSQRSAHNKMDSSNLSLILAPNLLHLGEGVERMNANAEKCLKLQAAVVHCFIEHARDFGVLPRFLMEKVPGMMGYEPGVLSPLDDGLEESDTTSGIKKKCRRSFGDVVNGALNKLKTNRTPTRTLESDSVVFSSATPVTPSSKRKLPLESGQSLGFSNKKRRSIIKHLGIDLLPSALFNGVSTPGSAYSTSDALDSPQNTMPSAGQSGRNLATSARRRSRRMSHRNAISRVESGRSGCFSPKVKKEASRKSLRLRFSLGKGSRDTGSESIGLRLATLENDKSFGFTKVTGFSPACLQRAESKSSTYISKSEDNLLTPQFISHVHRASWSAETPERTQATGGGSFTDTSMSLCLKSNYYSEPAIVVSKPPTGASLPKTLCCISTEENLETEGSLTGVQCEPQTGPCQLKIKTPFTESGPDLRPVVHNVGKRPLEPSESTLMPPPVTHPVTHPVIKISFVDIPSPQRQLADDQNITFGRQETLPLSPLHIDSTLVEPGAYCSSSVNNVDDAAVCGAAANSPNNSMLGKKVSQAERMNGGGGSSRLIEALDIDSPVHFKLGVAVGLQSTPYRSSLDFSDGDYQHTRGAHGARSDTVRPQDGFSTETGDKAQNQPHVLPESPESRQARVADHIQRFNKLTLRSPNMAAVKPVRSPLKFQRTPVRQAVRRINSLQGDSRRAPRALVPCAHQGSPVAKAVSLESGLCSGPLLLPAHGQSPAGPSHLKTRPIKKAPPGPPAKPATLENIAKAGSVLGDVTNKVLTIPGSKTEPFRAQKPHGHQMGDREVYRGSPRNPINHGRLLSATKPIDL